MCPPPSSLPPPPPQRQQPPPPPPPQRQQPPPPPPQRQQPPPPQRQQPPPSPRQQPPSPRQNPPLPRDQQSLSPRQPPPAPRQNPPSPRDQQSPSPRQTPPAPRQQPPSPRQKPPEPRQKPPQHQSPPQLQPPPPPQQQQLPYPPYPPYQYLHQRPKKKSSTLASCFLATSFLIFLTIAAFITCFILFRPQNPEISVHSMKFPSFTLLNGTANFTFFQYVAIRNPNRYAFSHYDSSVQLFSSSSGPLGFMYIPAGNIAAGKTQFMSATFDVKSFTLPPDIASGSQGGPGPGSGPSLQLVTKMKLVGSVKVFQVFAHHVEKGAKCRVSIQLSDGSVLGYKC